MIQKMKKSILITLITVAFIGAQAPGVEGAEATHSFTQGENWISLTGAPSAPIHSQNLLASTVVDSVCFWNEAIGDFTCHTSTAGSSFTLNKLGAAYKVVTNDTGALTYEYNPVSAPVTLNLKIGSNLVGFPFLGEILTSYQILEALPGATQVSRVVNDTIESAIRIPGIGVIIGKNFTIISGAGYDIFMESTETWTPPGNVAPPTNPPPTNPPSNNPLTSANEGHGGAILDNTPPKDTAIIINEGDESTVNRSVILKLSATDESPIEMKIGISEKLEGEVWEPYASSKRWELRPGLGERKVCVRFRDKWLNFADPVCDTINLVIEKQFVEDVVAEIREEVEEITTIAEEAGITAGPQASLLTNMRLGDTGEKVRKLQQRLASKGLYRGVINGVFDTTTIAAVRAYQVREGILPTGFVGPLTRARLDNRAVPQNEWDALPNLVTTKKVLVGEVEIQKTTEGNIENPTTTLTLTTTTLTTKALTTTGTSEVEIVKLPTSTQRSLIQRIVRLPANLINAILGLFRR
jgi:peptidoglycan hydrolase-like protein with peptidoglycan-binding domain